MPETLLRVDTLSSGYGDIRILWDVDLSIVAGEAVCLVGANGAGKTTLLRTLSGLTNVHGGCIRFAGEDITRARPQTILANGISHVPEGRRLFAPMSVQDNLLMGAYQRRDAVEISRDLDRMMALFPILAERRAQAAGTLSGGEQQMCAIARGLMSRPKLLMIDELSLGLAPQAVDTLGKTVRQISREGVAVLLVEQDVTTAFELTHRGIVLDSGRVTLSGSTGALADNPAVREAYIGLA